MGMIFDFYVHLYGQLPEKLLLVCRSWNVLALSQPTLWTNLDPLGQFGLRIVQPWAGTFLQSRIARSNPAPLKVDFTALSWDMPLVTVKKVASTPTFRPRIQELVISRAMDMSYLVGPQPLLKSLTIGGNYPHPLDKIIANPVMFKLDEKKLTTLRLFTPPKLSVWPDSLLQRIQTLEVRVTGDPGAHHEYWTIIQKSTTLRALHITPNYGCNPTLSHPSVRQLSLIYFQWWTSLQMSLEEVRMPRLRDLHIDTANVSPFMQLKLVETPVLSLRLICRPHGAYGEKCWPFGVSWVEGIVHFLHSTPHLQKMEISAPPSLVLDLMECFEKDKSLCAELNSFVVLEPMGVATEGHDKSTMEAKLDQLRCKAAAFLEERPSCM